MMRRAFRLGQGPDHISREVDEELAFHVEMRRRKLIDAGAAPNDADGEARRQFGNVREVRESCITLDEQRERAMHRIRYADEFAQDVGFAIRALRRNPAFALVVILTLALGIGANTAIFTLLDAVILRPLSVHAPEELIAIGDPGRVNSNSHGAPRSDLISYPLYQDIIARARTVTGILASGSPDLVNVRLDPSAPVADHPTARFVSSNYFAVLGEPVQLGRPFGAVDATIGAAPVVVVSDAYWRHTLSGDLHVIGRSLNINNLAFTIVGVTRPGFAGEVVGQTYALWLPLAMRDRLQPHTPVLADREASWLLLLARRRAGVSEQASSTELRQVTHAAMLDAARADEAADLKADTGIVVAGSHGFSRIRRNFARPLWIMLAGVALLLLIICANVANLLLARALARTPEFSVRLALGAGRGRLLRQLLTESAVLGAASALLGIAVAWALSRGLLTMVADGNSPVPLTLSFDGTVLGFVVAVSLIAVFCFGLLPAARAARLDVAASLRARGVTGDIARRGGRFPIGTTMIAGQVALSLVLLMGASLLVRTLKSLERVDVGLDRDHILMASVETSPQGYDPVRLVQVGLSLQQRIAAIPEVAAVSFSENGVFSGTESGTSVDVVGWKGGSRDDSTSSFDLIGPRYVGALGSRLISGRDITDADVRASTAHVALVNESFSRFFFGKTSPIGRIVRGVGTEPLTIVGVINDVRDHALDVPPPRRIYAPFTPPDHPVRSLNFEIRARGQPTAIINQLQRAVRAEDPDLIVDGIAPLTRRMSQSIAEQRLLAEVASLFGGLALLLAAIGLYGVMTYAVTRRTGEIGLRIALGADPARLVRMVVGDAFRLVGIGALVGTPLAYIASRALASQTVTQGVDWIAVGGSLAILATAAMIAALIPALRAARVEPLTALRQQ
jgi:putative ABC transport system permease protein